MMKLSLMVLSAATAVSSLSSLIVFLPSSSIIGAINAAANQDADGRSLLDCPLLSDCPLDCGINGCCELVYSDGDDVVGTLLRFRSSFYFMFVLFIKYGMEKLV